MEKDRDITFIISATIVLAIKFLVYGKFICVSNLPIALTIIIFVVILIGVIYNKAGNENEFSLKEEDEKERTTLTLKNRKLKKLKPKNNCSTNSEYWPTVLAHSSDSTWPTR